MEKAPVKCCSIRIVAAQKSTSFDGLQIIEQMREFYISLEGCSQREERTVPAVIQISSQFLAFECVINFKKLTNPRWKF